MKKIIIVAIESTWSPEDGDTFDAVKDALEFAKIPAEVRTGGTIADKDVDTITFFSAGCLAEVARRAKS
jgi:hypothetical protein